jgi:soluble lytic murein transglycosylase
MRSPATAAPARSAPQLAMAASATTSPLDLAAVKQAIELSHRGRQDEATSAAGSIADPLARKLVEWVILRSDEATLDFPRYAAFLAANPSWPGIVFLRRRAEAALWQQQAAPRAVIEFFRNERPYTAKGRFALARALLAEGDRAGAQAAVRDAWHKDGFSADVEAQARIMFADLISVADDKARMDARFDAEDDDAGLRAARQLGAIESAIAKARAAVINKSSKAKALLDAVPAAARHDAGYMFSHIQWLRRTDKIVEAAQWMLAAPREAERLGDLDQWWVERRLIARKLLDIGDVKAAYEVANGAAAPVNENYRAEQQFTAGWIALRFLREPAAALAHFARIAEGIANPITLARAYYWQGRATEALGRGAEARAYYETAARYPTAYYGQLARARLGIEAVTLRTLPEPTRRTPASGGRARFGDSLRHRRARPRRICSRRSSATKLPTSPRSPPPPRSPRSITTRGRLCLSARVRSGMACRSNATPFRTSACRTISRSDPRSNAASSIRSYARKARSIRG